VIGKGRLMTRKTNAIGGSGGTRIGSLDTVIGIGIVVVTGMGDVTGDIRVSEAVGDEEEGGAITIIVIIIREIGKSFLSPFPLPNHSQANSAFRSGIPEVVALDKSKEITPEEKDKTPDKKEDKTVEKKEDKALGKKEEPKAEVQKNGTSTTTTEAPPFPSNKRAREGDAAAAGEKPAKKVDTGDESKKNGKNEAVMAGGKTEVAAA
jgi:hypothetical protein